MSTAIELYKRAYDLDFRHGDIAYAEVLYRDIIAKYPNSVEKVYCEVHLERIRRLKSDPRNPSLKSVRKTYGSNGLVVFNFFLSILIMAAVGLGGWLIYEKDREIKSLELIIDGMANERQRDLSGALERYKQASEMAPGSFLPYRFMAESYFRNNNMEGAAREGYYWRDFSGGNEKAVDFLKRVSKEE